MPIDARERPPAGRIVLTYEDYCALPDDGRRYEILDGDLSVTPPRRVSPTSGSPGISSWSSMPTSGGMPLGRSSSRQSMPSSRRRL